ncbi:MAG TPA: arylesterase [Alphaproteobacteria bacterium]
MTAAGFAAITSICAGAARAEPARILVLGDSIAAGYGLAADEAFPARLESHLRRAGHEVRVIDAGVSGDTTAGGFARLDWALADRPHIVIVELGGNDGLRGIAPAATRANLDAILARLKARGPRVLLTGMLAPPNLGAEYGRAFDAIYPELAAKYGVALYPFVLDGVAAQPDLNQRDGIHPNARGVAVMVDRIAPYVVRLLDTPNDGG